MNRPRSAIALVLLGTVTATGCGVRQLEPMPAPPQVMPRLTNEPPPAQPGTTPVVIDSVDVPSRVYDQFGQDICVTPCVVNFVPGVHDLAFKPLDHFAERGGHPPLTVGTRPLVFRYELGHYEHHPGLQAGGLTLITLGLTGVLTGLPLALADSDPAPGTYVMIGSGIMAVAGIVMLLFARDVVQEGTGTTWSPEGPAPAFPAPAPVEAPI